MSIQIKQHFADAWLRSALARRYREVTFEIPAGEGGAAWRIGRLPG